MKLTSSAFKAGENIPKKYTADGQNINPALNFSEVPKETSKLVLIVDDPDAPNGTFTHWITIIPPEVKEIKENSRDKFFPVANDFGKARYDGPAPPKGNAHRYFFKLFAVNSESSKISTLLNRKQIESWMEGHILATAQLMGKYRRD